MRPVEMTGIVNRTTDFAQVRQNEDQKPVMEQAAFQTQFNKQVEKNSDTVVKKRDSEWNNEKFDAKDKARPTAKGVRLLYRKYGSSHA